MLKPVATKANYAELADEQLIALINEGTDAPLEYLTLVCIPFVEQYTNSQHYSLEFVKDACIFLRENILKGQVELEGRSLVDFIVKLCKDRWDRIGHELKLDEKLYKCLKNGDGWAFYYMQKKFFPQVDKMVMANSGTSEDAKDVIMDGIYILLRNIQDGKYSVQVGARLKTYFLRICRNKWMDELKQRRNRLPATLLYDLDVEQTEAYYYDAYQEEELNDRQRVVKDLFIKGTDVCQNVLRYYYYDKLSHKEIAQRMHYNSEEVSRTQKKKCLEKLRVSVVSHIKKYLPN